MPPQNQQKSTTGGNESIISGFYNRKISNHNFNNDNSVSSLNRNSITTNGGLGREK